MKYLVFFLAILIYARSQPVSLEVGRLNFSTTTNGSAQFAVNSGNSNGTFFVRVQADDSRPMVITESQGQLYDCHTQNSLALCAIRNIPSDVNVNIDVRCLIDCNFTIEAYRN